MRGAQAMRRNDRVASATYLHRRLQARKCDQTGGKTIGADVRYGHSVAGFQRRNRCLARDVVQRVIRRTHHVGGLERFAVRLRQRLPSVPQPNPTITRVALGVAALAVLGWLLVRPRVSRGQRRPG